MKKAIPPKLFGLGISNEEEENPSLHDFLNTETHPKDINDKLNKLLEHFEVMEHKNRDNNSILHQMMQDMEERLNKRIDDLRKEVLGILSNSKTGAAHGDRLLIQQSNNNEGGANKGRRMSSIMYTDPKALERYNAIPANNIDDYYTMVPRTTVNVSPYPGFVIKTRKLLDHDNKVFINIFHHELIDLEPSGMDQDFQKPFMFMESPTETTDKQGNRCQTFNVGISSEYFIQPNPKVNIIITAPTTIYKIIHKVNLQFKEFLDEGNYSIPRLASGFKGENIPVFKLPQLKSKKPADIISRSAPLTATTNITTIESESHSKSIQQFFGSVDDQHTNTNNNNNNNNDVTHRESIDNESIVSESIAIAPISSSLSGHSTRRSILQTFGLSSSTSEENSTVNNNKKMVPRKSVFNTSTMSFNGGTIMGRNMLSGEMLENRTDENINQDGIDTLKEDSVDNPTLLLGWQILLEEEVKSNDSLQTVNYSYKLYVVTDLRKNLFGQTEFRLSRFKVEDKWIKLIRGKNIKVTLEKGKGKYLFTPMRKVLFGLQLDEETIT